MALEAVRRIDALFEIERSVNGLDAEARMAAHKKLSAPLVVALETWMREKRAKLSRHNDVAKAMDYMLKRWDAFARFLDDGRICLSNNAAERALCGIALGRKSWLFPGSDRGGERAAVMYSLIVTAKMNYVDPQAWLADVLARIAGHPAQKLDELLPWNWTPLKPAEAAAARAAWLTEWILFDVRPEAWSVSSRRVSDEAEASLQSIRLHSMARALTRLRLLRPDFA